MCVCMLAYAYVTIWLRVRVCVRVCVWYVYITLAQNMLGYVVAEQRDRTGCRSSERLSEMHQALQLDYKPKIAAAYF